ncbi:MAG: hypothetical protein R6W77_09750 [Trueperaceae bacterium]
MSSPDLAVFGNVAVANLRKVVTEMLRYLPNTLSLLVTFYAIFLFMLLGVRVLGDPAAADANIRYVMVANAFWFLLILGVSSMGWEITTEATRGTLEQLYMTTTPAWFVLLTRMVATLAVNVVLLAAMVALSMATARQWLNLDLVAVAAILPPMLLAVVGLGFMVAGLAIVFKQIQAMLQIVQFVFMAMAFVPIAAAPVLELAPAVKGIDMARQVLAEGRALASFAAGDWFSLLASGVAYLALGLIVFRLCERRAMTRGLLGQY